jgi:hypothetical protein
MNSPPARPLRLCKTAFALSSLGRCTTVSCASHPPINDRTAARTCLT